MTKILIVEDEPNMVAGLRDNFEYEGYEVITAPDGVAGLERALKEKPDRVILDVMMPRMSGLDVCKQLKAKRASVPIIMLTARGQEVDKVVGLELGAERKSGFHIEEDDPPPPPAACSAAARAGPSARASRHRSPARR